MAEIKKLVDKNNVQFFPVTHINAVVGSDNTSLSEELASKQDAIEAIQVSIDGTSGTPSGSASMSGNTLQFSFSGIKGNDGATGPQGPIGPAGVTSAIVNVDNTSGTPSATATVQNGVLTINISGIKGEQGNSGYTGAAGELEVVNNDTDGGAGNAWSAERGKAIRDDFNSCFVGENGVIQEGDYTKTGLLINNGKYAVLNNCDSVLIPMRRGVTYTLKFAAGLGGYSIVLDSVAVSGASVNFAPGYSQTINTSRNDEVTLIGAAGQYLFVRADPVSNGRVFPIITMSGEDPKVILREEIDDEPVENGGGVVSSGGLYDRFAAINALLAGIKDVLPIGHSYPPGRQDVPVSSVPFSRRTPGGGASTTRVLSGTITIPNGATGFHIKCASGFMVIAYYLRANGTWDDSVQSSGAFAQNADLGAPNYTSGGIWVYFRKDNASATITVEEVQAAITEMYFDVPDSFYLPVASKKLAQKSISILFIGNSLTQDAVSYVPYLLRNLCPDVSFRFYIWYNGGYTLAQHYAKFTTDQSCEIFSECSDSINWNNYNNSVKMSDILSSRQFDIVCFQEYFNYKSSYTDADLVDINNCISYIRSNYDRNFKVVTLFHAPLRSAADRVFELTKIGNGLILKKTIAESMIAPGVAVYNALSSALDSLGDNGHLSPDGTHTQEGLPCLLQAYVVFLWIMRQLSIPISINNSPLRITTDIYNLISTPGPNLGTGVIPGSEPENLLAQEIAIIADKEGIGCELEAFTQI